MSERVEGNHYMHMGFSQSFQNQEELSQQLDRQTEVLDNLDQARFGVFWDTLITTTFENQRKMVPVVVSGDTLSGKTTFLQQLFEKLTSDSLVQALEEHHGVTLQKYHLGMRQLINAGRKVGIITSEPGRMTPEEYHKMSTLGSFLLSLGMSELPSPGVIGYDVIGVTGIVTDDGEIEGVDRGLTGARAAMVNYDGLCAVIATPELQRMKNLRARDRVRNANPDEVVLIQQKQKIEEDIANHPQQIQEIYRQSGSLQHKKQGDRDVNRRMYMSVKKNEMSPPGFPLRSHRSFIRHRRDGRHQFYVESYLPLWMRRLCGEAKAEMRGFIFENNPLAGTIHRYSGTFEQYDMVDALQKEAEKPEKAYLKSVLASLHLTTL